MSSQLLIAQTVGPLIKTQWGQGDPYNLKCPEIDGQHCLTSCGATAMAQLSYYHRWPEHGMGQGYWHFDGGEFQFVDLTPDYFEYDKMLLTYDANSSEEAKMAVALLMRDMAYLGAVFGLAESMSPSIGELIESMGYDKGMMHLDCGYFSQEDLKAIIRSELDAGRPVLLDGSNGSVGHAFLCDGYNDKGEYHFNYGWGGKDDGWSTLENCLFPLSMSISFNIKKDEGGKYGFTLSSDRDFKWLGGNKLYATLKFNSYHSHELQPEVALAVENTATHEVQYFYHTDKEPGDPNALELVWELNADLADGNYILYPVGHGKEENKEWKKAYFRDLCQQEVTLTVKDGVKTFANGSLNDPVREGAVEVDGLCYELDEAAGTAAVTYRNDKYASYSGDVVIPETITVDGKSYQVTAIGSKAFNECHYLGNVTIAKTVKDIGWSAFNAVTADKITFAEGSQLKSIGGFAFYVLNIKEIILPEGLETIGESAFANSDIESVTIPSTVAAWESRCFQTTSLVSVHVNSTTPPVIGACFRDNNEDFPDYDGQTSYGTAGTVLYVPAGAKAAYEKAEVWKEFGFILEPGDDDSFVKQLHRDEIEINDIVYQVNGFKGIARVCAIKKDQKDITLGNAITLGNKTLAVTNLARHLFNGTYDSIVIPASIETIGEQAFESTTGSLTFEEGSHLKTIGNYGFNGQTVKTPLVLPEGLETISQIFLIVSDLTIPASVTTIEDGLTLNGLKHLRVSWSTPLAAENLFSALMLGIGNTIGATLHVPTGTKELYANAEGWKLFKNIVEDNNGTAIHAINRNEQLPHAVYTLDGRRVNMPDGTQLPHGIYIIDGKKVVR